MPHNNMLIGSNGMPHSSGSDGSILARIVDSGIRLLAI